MRSERTLISVMMPNISTKTYFVGNESKTYFVGTEFPLKTHGVRGIAPRTPLCKILFKFVLLWHFIQDMFQYNFLEPIYPSI